MRFLLRGRRIIWWGWRVMPVAPRIVSDVSYVMRINHEIPFAWQAQYLVRLEVDACCSAHCTWPFICDADQSWHSFCVAGAVFGEVGGRFLSLRALKMTFHMWCASIMRFILRGRRSIWWGCRVIPLAPRIVNDLSCFLAPRACRCGLCGIYKVIRRILTWTGSSPFADSWCRMGHKFIKSCKGQGVVTGWLPSNHHSLALVGFQLRSFADWAWLPDDAEGSNLQHHLVVWLNRRLFLQVQLLASACRCVLRKKAARKRISDRWLFFFL